MRVLLRILSSNQYISPRLFQSFKTTQRILNHISSSAANGNVSCLCLCTTTKKTSMIIQWLGPLYSMKIYFFCAFFLSWSCLTDCVALQGRIKDEAQIWTKATFCRRDSWDIDDDKLRTRNPSVPSALFCIHFYDKVQPKDKQLSQFSPAAWGSSVKYYLLKML